MIPFSTDAQVRRPWKTTAQVDSQLESPHSDHTRIVAIRAVSLDISQTLGVSFVPELFEGMSARPAYLETAWELFKEDLQLDRLDYKTRRMIALAISTDAVGHYCITEYPRAFRLNALDETICDKIVLTIRFFKAFERYLSGVMPPYVSDTPTFVRECLRDEYQSFAETRASEVVPSGGDQRRSVRWIGSMLIMSVLLLPIVVGVYLYLQ